MTNDETRQVESQPATECRDLVALTAPAVPKPLPRYRQAPFLAQLIATKQKHPQTRERRRAEPAQAVNAYRVMSELVKWG